ncbi:hypothetical protein K2173_019090 [Erythroxylum novogranatense]|uniref:Protein kinase domain-containing protein n=1 Tax=Erythroxylum novogranatense TaxID=1862640 RepID=A0AAV8SSL9_9ROSI|nr:hypothetical protein K2173_019090 [Erythroxylum novogranatense]
MFQLPIPVSLVLCLTQVLAVSAKFTKPECQEFCGDVAIPFPFGIGVGCYMNDDFAVTCNNSFNPQKPFLNSTGMELLGVSMSGVVQVNNPVISASCNDSTSPIGVDLSGSPFIYSSTYNRFTAMGCDNYARLRQNNDVLVGGCVSFCRETDEKNKGCYGLNCWCASGFGFLLLFGAAWWLYKAMKRRKTIKLKQMFFKRNGGMLLQQRLGSRDNNLEQTKLFSSKELEKATDKYNVNRIAGQGGQGTVYKGMTTDGKLVAIKKSKSVDKGKLQEFINEVVILSNINHRNVVKLLGCCLETEVPLLVYEFVPNGTLFQHLHDPNEEFPVTWELRLRIATEVAGTVSYLHSAASLPIYHRDIKSTNILLDEKFRAKSFRLWHFKIRTFGYLDPEYFQSSQYTEKSDVYSFGVVLVELLTGQNPIRTGSSDEEEKSLIAYFLVSMEENRLSEILDTRVLQEGGKDEVIAVANLANRCLNLNRKKRPTMRAVAMQLEAIRNSSSPALVQQEDEEVEYDFDETNGSHDMASFRSEPGLSDNERVTVDVKPLLFHTLLIGLGFLSLP